jgi:DNA-binding NtrC family response regulator
VAQGLLRPELYFRLARCAIAVPPLRDHRDDVPALVGHFLQTFCSRRCGCIWGVAPEALAMLAAIEWPGNVRELRLAVDHAVTAGSSGVLQLAAFSK